LISWCWIIPLGSGAEEIRLGVVNPVKLLEASPQATAARKALEKEFAARDRQLVAIQQRIKQMEDRLVKAGATMGESERRKLEKDIANSKHDLRRDQDEFRDDLNFRRNEEFGKIQKQVVEAIQVVAREGRYDVVVGEGVVYADPRMDITDKVIERLRRGR
jgi:outer membrane protein